MKLVVVSLVMSLRFTADDDINYNLSDIINVLKLCFPELLKYYEG